MTAKKCTKKRDARVQSCCFANLNLLLYCRSRCLGSLPKALTTPPPTPYILCFPLTITAKLYIYDRPNCCATHVLRLKYGTTNWPAPNVEVFIAQLVEHCSANAEAMGLNPIESPPWGGGGYSFTRG